MTDLPVIADKKRFLKAVGAKPPKYLKADAIHLIIGTAKKDRYRLLFTLLWQTGTRISEALNIRVEDIDWQAKQIRVITLKRRGKSERMIPINDGLVGMLAAYVQTHSLKLTDRLFNMTPQACHMELKEIIRKADLPYWIHLHTFRHSFAVNCLFQGMTINTLKEIMGHANVENTMVYLKVFQPDVREQMSKVQF